jgi:tetratricopeptide (TPR) repeat protein
MEMSPHPEAAMGASDILRDLTEDMGHLTHMPTHIDIQCGFYRDAMYWNQRAIAADRKYYDRAGPMNYYSAYRAHNYHFAAYAAMFLGQYAPAIAAADELIETIPDALLRIASPPMADFFESYLSIRQHVLIRFGKWREIIAQELPADAALYCNTTAMMHYAKGVAHAALGEVGAAEAEQALFREAATRVPQSRNLHVVPCTQILAVAEEMLAGEIAYRRGEHAEAFAHLRAAIALEDALPYDEPWGWMQPARHALAALLMEQGRLGEAEAIYRADLGLDDTLRRACQHPNTVWSLHGLHECLMRRGEAVEVAHIKRQLDIAVARADVPIKASCYCRLRTAA